METGGKETEFTGLDLKVGGEGMKGFYDKILPDYMNKFGKKWGVKVGETEISTYHPTQNVLGTTVKVHSFDITPSMRESAIKSGFPLFQLMPPVAVGAGLVGERTLRKKEKRP
jgi:hypothetical protein